MYINVLQCKVHNIYPFNKVPQTAQLLLYFIKSKNLIFSMIFYGLFVIGYGNLSCKMYIIQWKCFIFTGTESRFFKKIC